MSHLELDKAFKVIALVRNPTIAQHEWKLNLPPDASLLNPHVANLKSRPLTVLHISDTHWDPDYLEGCCYTGCFISLVPPLKVLSVSR